VLRAWTGTRSGACFCWPQIPLFAHAGLISEEDASAFTEDGEALNKRGEFSAAFFIRTAVGVRSA